MSDNNSYGITLTNLQPLLLGAVSLHLDDCIQGCADFIRNILTMENCISYYMFCTENCPDIRHALAPFLWKNIKELGVRPEFQFLNPEEILLLIPASTYPNDADDMPEDSESLSMSELLLSIYNWMNVDVNSRLEHFIAATAKFPLAAVDPEVLRKIYLEDDNLKENSVCHNLYLQAIGSHHLPGEPQALNEEPVASTSSREAAQPTPEYTSVITSTQSCSGHEEEEHTIQAGAGGSPKRSTDDSDVEFLAVVPKRRNVTAEIDLTTVEDTAFSTAGPSGTEYSSRISVISLGTRENNFMEMESGLFCIKQSPQK